MQLNLSQCGFF